MSTSRNWSRLVMSSTELNTIWILNDLLWLLLNSKIIVSSHKRICLVLSCCRWLWGIHKFRLSLLASSMWRRIYLLPSSKSKSSHKIACLCSKALLTLWLRLWIWIWLWSTKSYPNSFILGTASKTLRLILLCLLRLLSCELSFLLILLHLLFLFLNLLFLFLNFLPWFQCKRNNEIIVPAFVALQAVYYSFLDPILHVRVVHKATFTKICSLQTCVRL